MFSSLLCGLLFVSCVLGHGWLNSPEPRGYVGNKEGSASTTAPCGVTGTYSNITYIQNGGWVLANYTIGTGHEGNGNKPSLCSFALSTSDQTTGNQFASNVLINGIPCPPGAQSYNIPVFTASIQNTTAYLQFWWSAGDGSNWYNCAQVFVDYLPIAIESVIVGTPISKVIDDSSIPIFNYTVDPKYFSYVQFNGPRDSNYVIAALKTNSIPSQGSYSSLISSASGPDQLLTACGSASAKATTYLSVFTNTNGTTGSYSFTPYSYYAFVSGKLSYPQLTDSLPLAGSKMYYTDSYSTAYTPRRLILKKTSSDSAVVSLRQSLQCVVNNTNSQYATGSDSCIDLSTSTAIKYLEVQGDAPFSFSLGIEEGTCANYSSVGSFLVPSLTLLLSIICMIIH